jgi:cyclic pyranopterin phosphate synthase
MNERHPTDRFQRPLHDLRISVTDRCNLRCTYCMPADFYHEQYEFLPRAALLSFEELTRIARIAVDLGVEKLRITGGEPLLRRDLPTLIRMLTEETRVPDLALTTNGILLPRHATALRDAGLKRATISLDSLREETFRAINGNRGSVGEVLDGIAAAQDAGFDDIKVNCVVQRGVNEDDILPLAAHFHGTGVTLRFIEFMDVGTLNAWEQGKVLPAAEILARLATRYDLEPLDAHYPGEVARRYRYSDGGGEVGIIASVTQPFCGDCSRLRLSADGTLYTCLFAQNGTDIRSPLRDGATDADLRDLLGGVWRTRTDRYSAERDSVGTSRDKVEMYHIGG